MREIVLHVRSFRSIRIQDIKLAPITVVYGPNGSGKSSLLYAPLVLRNLALNPNQPMASLFNFGFVNLGSLKEVAFERKEDSAVCLGISDSLGDLIPGARFTFEVSLSRQNSALFAFHIAAADGSKLATLHLETSLPYTLLQQVDFDREELGWQLSWNGLHWVQRGPALHSDARPVHEVLAALNRPAELLRRIAVAPLIRGFFQPQYSVTTPQPPFREQELASLLASDPDLEGNVSLLLEEICGREFRVRFQPGASVFTLQVLDKERRLATELVNDGFGVNQLVYILALALRKETEVILIEEPEIHLHPSMIRRFVHAVVEMSRSGKFFVISTHSEPFLTSLLAHVARGAVSASHVRCYLATRGEKEIEARFVSQAINEHGQVEGGLRNFVESELEDLKAFLGFQEP